MRCAFISLSTPWVGLHCCFYDYFIFQFLALPLSPHKKSIQKQPQTDARANPKCIFMSYRNTKKENITNMQSCHWVAYELDTKPSTGTSFFVSQIGMKIFLVFSFFSFSKKKSLQIKSCINSMLSTARWWTIGILGDSRAMVRRIWIHVYETLRWMDSTRSISMYLKTS